MTFCLDRIYALLRYSCKWRDPYAVCIIGELCGNDWNKRILQVFIDLITNNFNKNSMGAYTKKKSKTRRSANRAQFALPCYIDCRLCWGGSLFLPLFIRQVKYGDIVVIVWRTGGHEQFVPRTVDGHTLGALYTVFSRQQGLHFLSI